MDLQALKDKLEEATFSELETYVNDLKGQRDSARKESIDGRKGLKAKVAELEQVKGDLFERLGIESLDDLDELDPKGQAEAAKQYEIKLKRMEKDLAERSKSFDELSVKHRSTLQETAIRKAMAKHEFVDPDAVVALVGPDLVWEEDELLYRTEKGVIPLDEGLGVFAKNKPYMVKAAGAGGSGFRGASGNDAGQKNPWAKETRNLTEQARVMREDPQLAASLQAAATQH